MSRVRGNSMAVKCSNTSSHELYPQSILSIWQQLIRRWWASENARSKPIEFSRTVGYRLDWRRSKAPSNISEQMMGQRVEILTWETLFQFLNLIDFWAMRKLPGDAASKLVPLWLLLGLTPNFTPAQTINLTPRKLHANLFLHLSIEIPASASSK